MKLKRVAQVWLIIVLSFLFVGSANGMTLKAAPSEQAFSASLLPVAGLVQYLAKDTTDWKTLQDVQLINNGDQVRTGSSGFARLSVATGIEVSVFPTTQIELHELATGEDSGQTFNLFQTVGTVYVNVKQKVRTNDHVMIVLPVLGVRVHGSQYLTYVSSGLEAAVFSKDDTLDVRGFANQPFDLVSPNFVFGSFKNTSSAGCDAALLKDNGQVTTASSAATGDKQQAVRQLLKDALQSNLSPAFRSFVRDTLGLPASNAAADQDSQAILKALGSADLSKFDVAKFAQSYIEFWTATYQGTLTAPIATSGDTTTTTVTPVSACLTAINNAINPAGSVATNGSTTANGTSANSTTTNGVRPPATTNNGSTPLIKPSGVG